MVCTMSNIKQFHSSLNTSKTFILLVFRYVQKLKKKLKEFQSYVEIKTPKCKQTKKQKNNQKHKP